MNRLKAGVKLHVGDTDPCTGKVVADDDPVLRRQDGNAVPEATAETMLADEIIQQATDRCQAEEGDEGTDVCNNDACTL